MLMIEKSYSLRLRMLTRTSLLLLSIFIILSIGVWHYARQAADYSYDRLLNSASLSIMEGLHVYGDQVDLDLPYAAFEMMQLANKDKVFYQVLGIKGELITGYENMPIPKKIKAMATPLSFYNDHYLAEDVRVVIRRKRLSEPAVSGWVTVVLAQTLKARYEMMNDILYRSLVVLFGIMVFVMLVLWFAINRALEPLSSISKSLASYSPLLAEQMEATPIQEVAPLVKAINNYQKQLLANLNSMKTFIADASHQIRTVQSSTQAQLDIASQSRNLEELPEHLHRIREEHVRLTRLTNQLLAHAMVVHRGDTKITKKVNIETEMKQLLTECVRDNAHRSIDFSYQSDGDIPLFMGDSISLREAVRNLLDNAVLYGPEDNQIELSLHNNKGRVDIIVDDAGVGIPKSLREKVLVRFERLSDSVNGSGLGLSIVASVADAHGGDFFLEDSPIGGLRARIHLLVGSSA
ncbi:sensor histidine kinase [Marinomonas posidonica]|uniref:histidine kinase n=1 Tax=Marinomonas posidonica (strain CECT 7376 / NCIMB 14433 / IVIA-Po-181) TaxID=491952 RepID=F6CVP8_MARPP|nr:sensor histidine kinase [Marinomonas posidonica]AEF56522.1 integral membrane sensor signal transduction histidine kinase [Marinomonas posidonica IVIA-Po-181]